MIPILLIKLLHSPLCLHGRRTFLLLFFYSIALTPLPFLFPSPNSNLLLLLFCQKFFCLLALLLHKPLYTTPLFFPISIPPQNHHQRPIDFHFHRQRLTPPPPLVMNRMLSSLHFLITILGPSCRLIVFVLSLLILKILLCSLSSRASLFLLL